jgi:hypothetical protein
MSESATAAWGTEMRSCSSSVLVQETDEQTASVYLGLLVVAVEGQSGGRIRWLKLQRPVRVRFIRGALPVHGAPLCQPPVRQIRLLIR